jgi:hypothetical protein
MTHLTEVEAELVGQGVLHSTLLGDPPLTLRKHLASVVAYVAVLRSCRIPLPLWADGSSSFCFLKLLFLHSTMKTFQKMGFECKPVEWRGFDF